MKKLLVFTLLCIMANGSLFAQEQEKRSAVHISFILPMSTNGRQAAQYTNGTSLNILVGI
mgnify:CR=1 FL=1